MDRKLVAIIVGIVFLAALPLVCQLTKEPEPLTVDKIKEAYRTQNFSVANERKISPPGYQADSEIFMTINGAKVHLFTYSNVSVIEEERTNMEVDAESVMPEYLSKDIAATVRNKHYVLLIISQNGGLRERIATVFESLRNPGPPPPPAQEETSRRHF
ncbi:MAG: hypothetical protein R6V12_15205 [Candidatus Hydrogenedentota bacterium]